MSIGIPQYFELIDTQKTDPVLEKYTNKVIRKAFNKIVQNKIDLSV